MLIVHKKQWQFLKKSVQADCLPHAFLFSGLSSIGKKKIAFDLAKIIFCQEKDFSSRPCQKCRDCMDIENNSHPDLAFISNDSSEIKISQINLITDKRYSKIQKIKRDIKPRLSFNSRNNWLFKIVKI